MVQPPEPIDPNFQLAVGEFEGPLDLLLFLIQRHELDILELPVAFVTERYLAYLKLMDQLNLDVASEYLVMAATLAHIKSKMLLPRPPEDEDDVEEEADPREELIRRLLEYQKYKLAAEELQSRGVAGRDIFMRGVAAPEAEGPAPLADMGVFRLVEAFQGVLERVDDGHAFEISADRISIQERIVEIVDRLRAQGACEFGGLFEGIVTRYDIVVTFMAVLELAKLRLLMVSQGHPKQALSLQLRDTATDIPEELRAPEPRPKGESSQDTFMGGHHHAADSPHDATWEHSPVPVDPKTLN